MAKHRKPQPKKWTANGKTVRGGPAARALFGGRTTLARATTRAFGSPHPTRGTVKLVQYSRGVASGQNARIRSQYSTRTAQWVPKGYQVMPASWRMR